MGAWLIHVGAKVDQLAIAAIPEAKCLNGNDCPGLVSRFCLGLQVETMHFAPFDQNKGETGWVR
jgi:hypothetical protein